MPNQLRDIPHLLRTPMGRKKVFGVMQHYLWPLTARMAAINRRTRARGVRIVTVVGSFGKSTTRQSVIAALGDLDRPWRQRGGNHMVGVARTILALRREDERVTLEVGINRKGQMAPMARTIRPDVAVVTSIGSEHNRALGTLEETRDEKVEMVRALSPSGVAVLNGDDPNVRWMAGQTQAKVITFGLADGNDVRATELRLDWPRGMRFLVHAGGETREVKTQLIGEHMAYPVLAAVAVAHEIGCSLDECIPRLEEVKPASGRLHLERLGNGAVLLCDYFKSAPETIFAALDAFAEIPAGRRIVLLGEVSEPPGKQGPIYRAIGKRVAEVADRAILVGHSVEPYRSGAVQAGMPRAQITLVGDDPRKAVEALSADLRPDDVILIKGRDTQRLDRVALALMGRQVGCWIRFCRLQRVRCGRCQMLEEGWGDLPVVT